MNERYLCIHGHFYQPPRENPWLEEVEVEDSAAPFHDWNEKITSECYEPNSVSRILGADQKIAEVVNNYSKISFNFGPTLLSWLEKHRNDVYEKILEADRLSCDEYQGHGNALAQCYNHLIMPLASDRDKNTQVRWGIADFQKRFGRNPEGMWLPETAVDNATLEILADHEIKFTILAPQQAQAVRQLKKEWIDDSDRKIDPTCAYRCSLRGGRFIDIFFFDGAVSAEISFGGLLGDGERLVERLMNGFASPSKRPQLMHVATDGETFGHHHRFGDMAIAYAIKKIEREGLAQITNYSEYLALQPSQYEVKIFENTSWSCAHGVERWRADCGCRTGNPGYHQRWRAPLRESLDALTAELDLNFEREAAVLLHDPWKARDDYIEVILDRSPENRAAFLGKHARQELSTGEKIRCWKLLELQRHRLLMFASCGWFFSDISNIETVKVLEFAARAIQLAGELVGIDLEPQFVEGLRKAPGNKAQFSDGARVYQELVKPAMVDLKKGVAHYAISSLVEEYALRQRIYSFDFDRSDYRREEIGLRTLALGSVTARWAVTEDELDAVFAVLHLGGYDFHCAVTAAASLKERPLLQEKLFHSFVEDSTHDLLKAIDVTLGGETFAFKDLFTEERRKIGRLLLKDAVERARTHYRRIYEESQDVARLLVNLRIPMPNSLRIAAEYMLGLRLRHAAAQLKEDAISPVELRDISAAVFRESAALGCKVDLSVLKEALEQAAYLRLTAYRSSRDETKAQDAAGYLDIAEQLGVGLELWRLQNLFWQVLNDAREITEEGLALIAELADKLGFSRAVVHDRLLSGRLGLSTTTASGGSVSSTE
ncbi:MAG TPA: DUF3536 domain-containing protein [Acidobacteriota bacterium]